MTTLYKPVKIESAEQAEALPEGSILLTAYGPAGRDHRGDWWVGLSKVHPNLMRDRSALVPIEAEEEYGAEMKWDARTPHDTHVSLGLNLDNARWQAENNPDYATGRIMRQYRTPWEAV